MQYCPDTAMQNVDLFPRLGQNEVHLDTLRTYTSWGFVSPQTCLGCVFPTHTFPGEANRRHKGRKGRYRSFPGHCGRGGTPRRRCLRWSPGGSNSDFFTVADLVHPRYCLTGPCLYLFV